LTLTEFAVDLSMGDHRLDFSEPLTREIDRASVTSRYGNVELDHLGDSRARAFHTSSSMGNFSVDLGGQWVTDQAAELSLEHSMGDLQLNIPDSVRIADDSQTSVRFGEVGVLPTEENGVSTHAGAPLVRLDLSTTMGGTRVTRY